MAARNAAVTVPLHGQLAAYSHLSRGSQGRAHCVCLFGTQGQLHTGAMGQKKPIKTKKGIVHFGYSSVMVHVEDEHRRAILTSELVGACDERKNSLPAHIQVGQAAATQNVVGLSDILAELVILARPLCARA